MIIATADWIRDTLVVVQLAVLFYFLIVNAFLLVLLIASAIELRGHHRQTALEGRWRLLGSEASPTISMLAPAYNEELTITESVRSLLTLAYPNLEVVLVNDGSSDETMAVLTRDFDLVAIHPIFRRRVESEAIVGLYRSRAKPELVVVDKENGGKADALNAGLNVATGELVCAIDADTIIEADSLLKMVRPFLVSDGIVAAGGTIRAANGSRVLRGRVVEPHAPRRFIPGVQAVEYLRAFLTGRLGWNRLGGNLIISGAFGLFRREATLDAGGYEHDTVGEDMELVARLRRRGIEQGGPRRVEFVPDPVAWTEVPESLRILGRQRDRWHRGLADVVSRHRRVFMNPRYGTLGLLAFPYFALIELLAPVVEVIGIVTLIVGLAVGTMEIEFALLFLLLAYGFGVAMTVLTLALEEWSYGGYGGTRERLLLFWFTLLEPFGYRQLTTIWRIRGLVKYLRGKNEWGVMTRSGFAAAKEGAGEGTAGP
jgi:cellulose synthase/poly-beta-1,6-N-acetylglucosamine synthase-like glycosyltransferase